MFIRLIFFICILLVGCGDKPAAVEILLDDMALYKLANSNGHQGDLLEHSVWAYYAAVYFTNHTTYATKTITLTPREKYIVQLGALLHDLGKAGQCELFFNQKHPRAYKITLSNTGPIINYLSDKREHVEVGFKYFAQPILKTDNFYMLFNQKYFNMSLLLKEHTLSFHENCILALVVGMHWELGAIGKKISSTDLYLDKAEALWKQLTDAPLTTRIINLCILVQLADVLGIEYHAPQQLAEFKLPHRHYNPQPVRKTKNSAPLAQIFGVLPLDTHSSCGCAQIVNKLIQSASQRYL